MNGEARRPGILSASLLFLATMLLVVSLGSLMQLQSLAWGLIGTEVFLLLLPTLFFLLMGKLPARETLRLRGASIPVVLLGLLLGGATWFLAVALDGLTSELLGYATPTPAEFYPATPAQAALLFIALALSAPICEELLFRGYIQRAWEGRGARAGIVVSSLLFAFFHMRFQGLLALLPLAFLFGWLAWRSRSILPAMAAHFAANALAWTQICAARLWPGLSMGELTIYWVILPLVLLAGGMWVYRWITRPETQPAEDRPSAGLKKIWPLPIAGLVYLVVAAIELLIGLAPQIVAAQGSLELRSHPWAAETAPQAWEYVLETPLGDRVGKAQCQLGRGPAELILSCHSQVPAFESRRGSSVYLSDPYERTWTAAWSSEDLRLIGGEITQISERETLRAAIVPGDAGLALSLYRDGREARTVDLPADVYLEHEAPWRLAALPWSSLYAGTTNLAAGWKWEETQGDIEPSVWPAPVIVYGAEPLVLPAGHYVAWRVNIGENLTAWYDAEAPHTLLRLEDGFLCYLLEEPALER